MSDRQKVQIQKLPRQIEEPPGAAEELTPEEAEQVQGGSATGGAGSGKIKFNEFTIKKTSD